MPDWEKLIRDSSPLLRLSPVLARELVCEWASHLEEAYEAHLREGRSPEAALRRNLDQIRRLSGVRLVLRVLWEVLMRNFTKQVALPGVMTFALATVIGAVFDFAHLPPKTILFSDGLFLSLPIPLLCVLPLCGAAGAYVSHRRGGAPVQRVLAALFLPAIMSALFVAMVITGWAISRFAPNYGWNWSLVIRSLSLWLTGYAILPAIPLLLGSAAEVKWGGRLLRVP